MARFRENLDGGLVTSVIPDDLQPGEVQTLNNFIYVPSSRSPKVAPSRRFDASSTDLGATISGLRFCAFDFVPLYCKTDLTSTTVTVQVGDNTGISSGAKVFGDPIAAGVTVSSLPTSTTLVLSTAPTQSGYFVLYFQADNYLVAQSNGTYKIAQVPASSTTLTFGSLATVTEGTTLEAIHYANEHILLNGKNANLVLKSNKSTRAHGMQPVITAPTATVTTSGGTWSYEEGVGLYSYWTTEVDKSQIIRLSDGTVVGDGIESTFEGRPAIANIVTTSYFVTVKRPPRVNSTATHWRLYRSTKYDATTEAAAREEDKFPEGYLVGEAEMKDDGTQETMIDGQTTASSAANKVALSVEVNTTTGGGATWQSTGNLSNPGGAGTNEPDGLFATLDTSAYTATTQNFLRLGNFGFTTTSISPPIVGIVIKVKGKISTGTFPAAMKVRPVFNNRGFGAQGTYKPVPLTTSNTEFVLPSTPAGAEVTTDLWGLTDLSPGDFADGKFAVEIVTGGSLYTGTLSLDSVRVTLYYNQGKQTGSLDLFPSITVVSLGQSAPVGRNAPPPVASTGDVFQDSLVLNDVTDDSIIRYSFPTKIDYFPAPYYLNFETREQDKVTNIKAVGNVCIIGLRRQIYRVNYLPRETDAEFDRGRAVELVETGHGIMGTQAACLVSFPDMPQQLAYVSQYGLHITDGYRTRLLSGDINWAGLGINPVDKVILINNPELYSLEICYGTSGGNNTKVLYASYHPQHMKQGGLKFSGPVDYTVHSATTGYPSRSGGDFGITKIYTGSSTNKVEEEQAFTTTYNGGAVNDNLTDTGAARALLVPVVKTRRMWQAGFGNEWRMKNVYVRFSNGAGENITATPTLHFTNAATVSPTTQTFTGAASTKSVGLWNFDSLADAIDLQLGLSFTGSTTIAFDYLVFEGEGFGEEEHA